MALTVVGTSTGEYSNQGIKTLTWPAGVASGDIAFVITSVYENALIDGYIQAQHSFTEATPSPPGWYSGSANTRNGSQVFYKECAGTESGTMDWDVTGAATIYANIALVVFSAAGNLTYASISAQGTGSSVTDAVAPSVSGTSGQHLFCVFGITDPPGTTNSAPSGMTLSVDGVNTGANSVRAYHETLASTGATGTRTWDFTNTRDYGTFSVLIDEESNNTEIAIPVGSTSYTTYDVDVGIDSGPTSIPIDVTALTFTGNIPSVDVGSQSSIPIGVGSIQLAQYTPSIGIAFGVPEAGENPETFPDDGNMAITGYNVTLTSSYDFGMSVGSVTITSYDLEASSTQDTSIAINVGTIITTTYAPIDETSEVQLPDVGAITFSTYAPSANITTFTSHNISPDQYDIAITGNSYTFQVVEVNRSIQIPVGSLILPGWKPPYGTEPSVEIGLRKRRKILGFLK